MSKGELHLNTGFATGHQPFPMDLRDYVDALYCYALVLCRNPTESEDLVQETCLRALRAMGKLRPDTNAKAWLFTILRNVWLNQLRQSRTAPQTVEFEADESIEDKTKGESKDPHETYVSEFERKEVQNAIRQLSSEFREVIRSDSKWMKPYFFLARLNSQIFPISCRQMAPIRILNE